MKKRSLLLALFSLNLGNAYSASPLNKVEQIHSRLVPIVLPEKTVCRSGF
ncbi:hypothetical protein RIK65_03430 [Enterobacter asburiae]|nr:hypothetical protein [Enterobacter asburiae]WNI63508.1 hypothetical protein RIL73_01670 [Enterobacter asburiae]WNI68259.1 hypothetical protein RIK65_03430 [Enterobacter asburiae]